MSFEDSGRSERSNSDRPSWKRSADPTSGAQGRGSDAPRGRSDDSPRSRGEASSRARSDDSSRSRGETSSRGRFGDDRPRRDRTRDDRPKRDRPGRAGEGREGKPRPEWETRVARPPREDREKSPMIPEEITDQDLDLLVRVQMKTLSPENAERVARHLAMVKLLINDDPELAHRHALAAVDRASRIGVVRETVGLTAYTVGDFALALREMQAYRRITGNDDQLPIMVDCERGLGRPEKALELGRSIPREKLDAGVRVNLAIAMSGARLDLGQNDMALAELEIPELNPEKVFDYSPALFFAYSDTLEILERGAEAKRWLDLAQRAEKALAAKAAPAIEMQSVVEELTIPEPYEAKAGGGRESDRAPRDGDRPRREGEYPRRDGDRTRRVGDRQTRDGDRPRRDGDRTGSSGGYKGTNAPSEGSVDSTGEKQVLRFGIRPKSDRPTRDGGNESAGERPGWKKPDGQ